MADENQPPPLPAPEDDPNYVDVPVPEPVRLDNTEAQEALAALKAMEKANKVK